MSTPVTGATERTIDDRDLLLAALIGVPAAIGAGAAMTISRSFFDTTNAALIMMLVVVAVAALGGRTAGIITALAAAASFDFFHTLPYLSMTIDTRDDIETTVLLLVAGILAGTLGARERLATSREQAARTEIRRVHRVAAAAASGRPAAEVIAIAEHELRELLSLTECRFEQSHPSRDESRHRLDRNGGVEPQRHLTYAKHADGRGGFQLPNDGVELPVLVHGEEVGHFVLVPTLGVPTTREDRLAAVVIADQVSAAWTTTRLPQ